ncbi:hypothetical protein L6452_37634 [Arctium lappa]|uniref:Uncharacterized protein n=1 Tax=Arctium lappa TaxID=4217 RepID=A0ACB8Y467_ARCLA|nr:hypothetical protein L6452_37634 [Arctium lappa]
MVRAGRPTQVVEFFDTMANDYGFLRNFDSLKFIVSKLCEHGFASYAEKLVTNVAHEFFPDEFVCDTLIKGWCVDGKLDEARRLSQEMYRGGFEIGSAGYNAILDCVCRVCQKKDPFRVRSEVEKCLTDALNLVVMGSRLKVNNHRSPQPYEISHVIQERGMNNRIVDASK